MKKLTDPKIKAERFRQKRLDSLWMRSVTATLLR
jgi:hypothetical protein